MLVNQQKKKQGEETLAKRKKKDKQCRKINKIL